MTKKECMSIIRRKIAEYESERVEDDKRTSQPGCLSNYSWLYGVEHGLKVALEIVGMIDKPNQEKTIKDNFNLKEE